MQIEDFILGNLPDAPYSEEVAVEANQCSDEEYVESLNQLTSNMNGVP